METRKEDINENDIKEKIYTKISKLLPQDVALILPEGNPIKKKYYAKEKKKFYNFEQYMKALNSGDKDLYKISIIYTFSHIVNSIDGYDHDEFMISAISSEEKLKTHINDIKNKNKKNKNSNYILIRFEDFNTNKIQFITDYILHYCNEDKYHYILIIYLHRIMKNDSKKKQKIYSVPNIYENINQLFIDNLKGPEITLKDLLTKSLKEIMFSNIFSDLDKEFRQVLTDFVYDRMANKIKFELDQNSQTSDLSSFLNKKYGEKNQANYTNEENIARN